MKVLAAPREFSRPFHGVRVGAGVFTRTTICFVGPMLPLTSRNRTVKIESPVLNAAFASVWSQN